MLKRTAFVIVFTMIIAGISSCGFFNKKSDDDFDMSEAESAFSYLDPKIDISLMIDAPGWRYEKDDEAGMVMFYEPEDYDGLTSFAISSNTKREAEMTEADLSEIIDYMGEASRSNLTAGIKSLVWENAEPVMAGKHEAARYTYTGELKSTGSPIRGDYLFWWTDERLYICSFIAFSDIYEGYFDILTDSLETFKTYAEIGKENSRQSNQKEQEDGIEYSDPQIDIFFTLQSPGWEYMNKENSKVVMFFKEESDWYTSFALNSVIMSSYDGTDEIALRYVEQEWKIASEQLGTFLEDVECGELDDIQVGDYFAKRYHFTGNDINVKEEAEGDYIFWWIKDRLYICSLVAYKKEYRETFDILCESLLTFKQQSTMGD